MVQWQSNTYLLVFFDSDSKKWQFYLTLDHTILRVNKRSVILFVFTIWYGSVHLDSFYEFLDLFIDSKFRLWRKTRTRKKEFSRLIWLINSDPKKITRRNRSVIFFGSESDYLCSTYVDLLKKMYVVKDGLNSLHSFLFF